MENTAQEQVISAPLMSDAPIASAKSSRKLLYLLLLPIVLGLVGGYAYSMMMQKPVPMADSMQSTETPTPTETTASLVTTTVTTTPIANAKVVDFWFGGVPHRVTLTKFPSNATVKFASSENADVLRDSVTSADSPDIYVMVNGTKTLTIGTNWASTDTGFQFSSALAINNTYMGSIYRIVGGDMAGQYLPATAVSLSAKCNDGSGYSVPAPCRKGDASFVVGGGSSVLSYTLICNGSSAASLSACDNLVSGLKLE